MNTHPLSPATRAVRASIATDREHGAVVPPMHLSSTFSFERFNAPRQFDYTRSGNPTRAQLGDALAALEGGASAVVTNTGMSAVTLVLQLLGPADSIVAAHDCYGGTQRLLRSLSRRGQFRAEFIDLTSDDAGAAIAARKPKVIWAETPSNPLLRITDIRKVVAAAHSVGALVVVDNTFLSPVLQQPLALGADLVVHSTTKYLNGHSDVVGGAVVARDAALGSELAWWANCLGITGAPFDSFLTLRGVRTLFARMRDHLAGADAVVEALCNHPAVRHVHYPGLATHPGHEIARAQQAGFGAMVSFDLDGGVDAVERLTGALTCFTLAESLGGVESLVAHPATMTHASMDAEARAHAGITDSLVRLSVGIESPQDLVNDLYAALDQCRRTTRVAAVRERERRSADLVLLGPGAIGRELLTQATDSVRDAIRVCAVVDRSGFVFDPGGIPEQRLHALSLAKREGRSLAGAGGRAASTMEAMQLFSRSQLSRPILVDATPAETSDVLHVALARGFDVVLANKVPMAAAQHSVDRLRDVARRGGRTILHEATVGAGLPVLDTLRKLGEAGDRVRSIEGCPSGTLGFLFGELGRGEAFSVALRRAVALGYTEPDPRVDLSGLDVARKALILARAIGFRGDISDIRVESLVPIEAASISLEQFLDRAEECDQNWAQRINAERRKGRVLRYRAHVTPNSVVVGLTPVRLTDTLGALDGTDNQFAFTTDRYHAQPLVIRGPGAGAAVTAAGVLNDILRLAREQ
ncbi:MAG TPA: cystathionine gamma-synthase [Gemmatimonadaceae bacterium]|nr:cystathionine gamma-synthase [Gemmatimonadaceae bacterium]